MFKFVMLKIYSSFIRLLKVILSSITIVFLVELPKILVYHVYLCLLYYDTFGTVTGAEIRIFAMRLL